MSVEIPREIPRKKVEAGWQVQLTGYLEGSVVVGGSDANGSAPSHQVKPIFLPANPVNQPQAITSLALRLASSEQL